MFPQPRARARHFGVKLARSKIQWEASTLMIVLESPIGKGHLERIATNCMNAKSAPRGAQSN
jgi:hypothetical protein